MSFSLSLVNKEIAQAYYTVVTAISRPYKEILRLHQVSRVPPKASVLEHSGKDEGDVCNFHLVDDDRTRIFQSSLTEESNSQNDYASI